MAFPNKFPGQCKCGTHVNAFAGTVTKTHGKWVVSCVSCQTEEKAETRVYTDVILWPNGCGYTPCTAEYRHAFDAAEDAASFRDSIEDTQSQEWRDAENSYQNLRYKVDCLQGEGRHLGKSVRQPYDASIAAMAEMLGGRL